MDPVSVAIVGDTLVACALVRTNPQDFAGALKKVSRLSGADKQAIAGQPESVWSELFLGDVEWYFTKLEPQTLFVNRTADAVLGEAQSCGKSMDLLLEEYEAGTLALKEKIDQLRTVLPSECRIIALTQDQQEYAIVEGWEYALAFILEHQPVPLYVGIGDEFRCFQC